MSSERSHQSSRRQDLTHVRLHAIAGNLNVTVAVSSIKASPCLCMHHDSGQDCDKGKYEEHGCNEVLVRIREM